MKKILLTGISVMFFGLTNAQDTKSTGKNIEFGAKAGLNLSMVKASKDGDSKMKAGFHVGGVVEFKFSDKIGLQPELMYSQEGGKYEYVGVVSPSVYNSEQDITLSKIILPVMFKYYVIEGLSIEAGPQLDYIISAKSDNNVTVVGTSGAIMYDVDMEDNPGNVVVRQNDGSMDSAKIYHDYGLNKLNFGFNLGAGCKLPMGLFFQARYNLGLTDFVDNGDFMSGTVEGSGAPIDVNRMGNSMKNSNLQISVGYKF